jgi:2-polyprenyl-3-methyl-5-hydroxy-6-metoxy-1,4-benzoquinol methylase
MKCDHHVDGVPPSLDSRGAGNASSTAIKKWDVLAAHWNDSGPPSSPSPNDIRSYRRFLKLSSRGLGSDILILGCTPRLRNLVAAMRLSGTCVDISAKMLTTSTKYVSRSALQQQFTQQNWLSLDLGRQFSAIVGDKVFENVPHSEWPTFKLRLLAHLRPGGRLIIRVAPQDPKLLGRTFRELFEDWSQRHSRDGFHVSQRHRDCGNTLLAPARVVFRDVRRSTHSVENSVSPKEPPKTVTGTSASPRCFSFIVRTVSLF